MFGMRSKGNIDFDEYYDQEGDVYYVTFKTGEPSYSREIDDILILDMGMFSNLPTGFRILNFKKMKVMQLQFAVFIRKINQLIEEGFGLTETLKTREQQVKEALQEVLSK
jgi:hypothetical protein